jgi:hypothetical protein
MRIGSALTLAGLAALAVPSTAAASFSTTSSSSFFYSPTRHGEGVGYGGALNNFWLHFPGAWSRFQPRHFSHGHFGRGWSGWGNNGHHDGSGDGPISNPPGDGPGGTIGGPGDPPPVVTPEPVTMTLLATGLAGVGAVRTRRRRNLAES